MSNHTNEDDFNNELELQKYDDLENRKDNQLISSERKQSKLLNSNYLKIVGIIALLIVVIVFVVEIRDEGSQQIYSNQSSNSETIKWTNIKEKIVHKQEDKANYEYLQIPKNNLKVLLITQKNLKISGASLDVRVGSQNNPQEFQGLAHLLEHMLFMGSQKYPEEDAFGSLVSKSGGRSNAYTGGGNTNYFFESTHNNFLEIIDIWSRFFIDPLLKEDQLQREVKAVDSEYMNTLTREGFRLFNLYVDLTDEGHPFKIFSCGNRKSLVTIPKQKNLSTYNALRSFKKKYYFSENMSLVIKSDETLRDNLKKVILESFQQIPTRNQNLATFNSDDEKLINNPNKATTKPPITKPIHSVLLETNPTKKLVITFFLEFDDNDKYTSIQFVKDLFVYGFQGMNFCFMLEDRHLATQCQVEEEQEDGTLSQFLMFSIEMQLSKEENIEEIIKLYFYFMDAIDKYPQKNEAYQNIKNIKKSLFNLLDSNDYGTVMNEVSDYSQLMNLNKLKDIQSSSKIYKQFNEEHIKKILNVLTDPSKIVIIHITSNSTFTKDKTILRDKVNDLNYTNTVIPQEKYLQFKQNYPQYLPKIIPVKDFGKITDQILNVLPTHEDDIKPQLILMNERGRIYMQKDLSTFKKPLQSIHLKFESPILAQDVKSKSANLIILKFFIKELQRKSHLLKLSGLNINIESAYSNGGFTVIVSCLDSQVNEAISKVKESLQLISSNLLTNKEIFEEYKNQVIVSLINFENQMVYMQFMGLFNSYIHKNSYSSSQILKAIQDMTLQDIKTISESFLDTYFLTVYAFGDVDQGQIKNSFDKLSSTKRTEPYEFQSEYIVTKNNPITLQLSFNSGDKVNSFCGIYYPIGKLDRHEQAILSLIDKPMRSQAFNYLRTQLQLGYVVSSMVINLNGFYGVVFVVQGSKHNPDIYDQHIEEFLQKFEVFLSKLESDDIESMQESIIQSLNTQKFTNFQDKSNHFWNFIDEKSYEYSKNADIIQILENNTFSSKDLKNFFVKYFKNTNSRFSIQLFNPSKVKQSDLPIKPKQTRGYSGNLGKYITSREEFNSQTFDHYIFKDQVRRK